MKKKYGIFIIIIIILLFIPFVFGAWFNPLPLPPCNSGGGGGSCLNITTLIYNDTSSIDNDTLIISYSCGLSNCTVYINVPTH